MGERVKQQLPFLQLLTISSQKQLVALLDTISSDQVDAVCTVFKNIRLKNVDVNAREIADLLKHKKDILILTNKEASNLERTELIKLHASLIVKILKSTIEQLSSILE